MASTPVLRSPESRWGNVGCFSKLISSFLRGLARVHLGHGGHFQVPSQGDPQRGLTPSLGRNTRTWRGSCFWSRGTMPSGCGVNPSVEHLWSFSFSSPSEGKRGRCARQGQAGFPPFPLPLSLLPPSFFFLSSLSLLSVHQSIHPSTYPRPHVRGWGHNG